MVTHHLFAGLQGGERFKIDTRQLTRVATGQTREINSYASGSFTFRLFDGLRGWLDTTNDALALSGWQLVWDEQLLRVYDKAKKDHVESFQPFSPDSVTGRPLPDVRAKELFLRAERLPSP